MKTTRPASLAFFVALSLVSLVPVSSSGAESRSVVLSPSSTRSETFYHSTYTPLELTATVSGVDCSAGGSLVVRDSDGTVVLSTTGAPVDGSTDRLTFTTTAGDWAFATGADPGDWAEYWGDVYVVGHGVPLPYLGIMLRDAFAHGDETQTQPPVGTWYTNGTAVGDATNVRNVDLGAGFTVSRTGDVLYVENLLEGDTAADLVDHETADDPHGSTAAATAGDASHLAADDPHGSTAAAATAAASHLLAIDPHGDRAYADSLTNAPTAAQSLAPWSLVIIPDSQNVVATHPDIWAAQTEWIRDNVAPLNVQAIIHLGDLTQSATPSEWTTAQNGISTIEEAGVPVFVTMGNHDYDAGDVNGSGRDDSEFNTYFPTSRYAAAAAVYEADKAQNIAVEFEVSGEDWLWIGLEFGPRAAVVAWADGVISNFPAHRVISTTHSFLWVDGTRSDSADAYNATSYAGIAADCTTGEELWQGLFRKHGNVEMILNGHHITSDGVSRRWDFSDDGRVVNQLLSNYQTGVEGTESGGEGKTRILTFFPGGAIQARTYNPTEAEWLSGASHNFALYPWPAGSGPSLFPYDVPTSLSAADSGAIIAGRPETNNVVIDGQNVQARNNGAAAPLYLNQLGGGCYVTNGTLYVNEIRFLDGTGLTNGTVAAPSVGWDVSDAIVGEWMMDDDAASTVVADSVGSNNGAMVGGNTADKSTVGKVGLAFNSDGSGDYINAGTAASLNFMASDFSVSTWVWADTLTGYMAICTRGAFGGGGWYTALQGSTPGQPAFIVSDNSTAYFVISASPIPTGEWVHLAFVREGSVGRIYENGVEVTYERKDTYPNPTTHGGPFVIGRNSTMTSGDWDGKRDLLRVYNRALTQTEITGLYNSGSGSAAHSGD